MKIAFIYLFFVMFGFANSAFAGGQQYEVLQNETRQLMSKMVSDSVGNISSFDSKVEEIDWVFAKYKRVKRYLKEDEYARELLKAIHYESLRAGLDPNIVLGLIEVESGFKKYAVSSVGARGYMQIMPFWISVIGASEHNLFDLRTNLRYGCTILRHYLDIEKGNMSRALARYNGSLGKSEYPNAVWAAVKRYEQL